MRGRSCSVSCRDKVWLGAPSKIFRFCGSWRHRRA